MKIISYNVNGLRSIIKKESFIDFIKSSNADIIILQETKINGDIEIPHTEKYPFQYFSHSLVKKGHAGVCMLSKYEPCKVTFEMKSDFDNEGRLLIAEFYKFTLINVYVPNSGQATLKTFPNRMKWDINFKKYIKSKLEIDEPLIIMGDFNTILSELDYWKSTKENLLKLPRFAGLTVEERDNLHSILDLGLTDTFRKLHPNTRKYTYVNYLAKDRSKGWRIDFALVNNKYLKKVINSDILTEVIGSDHFPIILNIKL